jgi:hypothetical protein
LYPQIAFFLLFTEQVVLVGSFEPMMPIQYIQTLYIGKKLFQGMVLLAETPQLVISTVNGSPFRKGRLSLVKDFD